jgi:CheY-like chemotaxis protein
VWLRFDIEDTGIGISAEEQAHIFEPFVRAVKPGTQEGSGLGLAIVRQYVELMGGTIGLESKLDHGSRFCVKLLVEREAESEAAMPLDSRPRVVGIEPGQPEYRVLIVEDQFENRLLLRRLPERVGFEVRVAEDGAEGIEIFEAWRPHFIWMDRRMSGIDGLETVRRIRELDGGREVKIAAVSASVSTGERDEMLVSGLDDFLAKPYRLEEIFDCMARHLGVRDVRAENASGPGARAKAELRPGALATIPEELREELADTLITLNAERINETIRRISEVDPELGGVLAVLAGRHAYTPIFKALGATTGRR